MYTNRAGTKPIIKSSVHEQTFSQSANGPVDETANERNEEGNKFTIPNTISDKAKFFPLCLPSNPKSDSVKS